MNRIFLALAILAAAATTACTPPKVLVADDFGTKYVLQENGQTQNSRKLYNFIIRACDRVGDTTSNCKDSVILDNVVARSVY